MNLRSGTISEYRPIKSKGFNVKGRASNPYPQNILLTFCDDKKNLAKTYGIGIFSPEFGKPACLENAYYYERSLNNAKLHLVGADIAKGYHYLLLGYGEDYLYYGLAPLPVRSRRPNPKAAKPDPNFPADPSTDQLKLVVKYTGPTAYGSEQPTRDGAMGDSALNYASKVYGSEWARERRWEWLHIVGHALGGNNEVGNLVAGTYDANTQMIPYEKQVQELSQQASFMNPLEVTWTVNLYPDAWLAIDITMEIKMSGNTLTSPAIPAVTSIEFDKFQYDLWLMKP